MRDKTKAAPAAPVPPPAAPVTAQANTTGSNDNFSKEDWREYEREYYGDWDWRDYSDDDGNNNNVAAAFKGKGKGKGRRTKGKGKGKGKKKKRLGKAYSRRPPCKFYHLGTCTKGNACEYFHSGKAAALLEQVGMAAAALQAGNSSTGASSSTDAKIAETDQATKKT